MAQHTFTAALPARLTALAAVVLLAAACGNGPSGTAPGSPGDGGSAPSTTEQDAPPGEGEGTELAIERSLDGEAAPGLDFQEGTWTLTCAPAGGDHPAPEEACARIDEVGTDPFVSDGQDKDVPCTLQYGGPEVVRVTGHIDGTEIDTEFTKQNGCEIERFDTVAEVVDP